PVIRVEPLQARWASWDPIGRVITITPALIERHAWNVVLEILKHEMAHQLVTELYGDADVHGAMFAQACDRLGVIEWARTASGELPETISDWRERGSADPEAVKLLDRIEKLLALA